MNYFGIFFSEADNFCIEIRFKTADYNVLWKNQQLTLFKDALIQQVCDVTGITASRMNQVQVFEGSVVFSFFLLPPREDDDGGLRKALILAF